MSVMQAFTNRAIFQSLRSTTLAVTGGLCTLGGLIADVLQPIAPFASYLFFVSLAALVVLFLLYRRGNEEILGAVAFSGVATAVFGLILLFQSGEQSEEVGFVAAAVPAVAELQSSLGIIDAKLDAIAEDTQSLKESAERIEDNSEQVLRTLDEIRASFATGGVIAKPASPEDHYHNARLHELGGDYSAARRSYLAYFQSDLPLLDPHLRFLAFLRVQEGSAGARETYNTLMAGKTDGVPNYVKRLLLDRPQRIAALREYAQENPDYAPAYYHLSLDYGLARLGSQTLSIMREEKEILEQFQAADDAGGLLKHMVDQSLVNEWREDAARRLQKLNAQAANLLENPVSLTTNVNNAGYTVSITVAEPATEILWRAGSTGDPRSTGDSGIMNPQTGKTSPQMFFNLPRNQRDTTLEISYRDASGDLQGPFEFPFKGRKESADANKRILESTTTSWVEFRDYNGSRLLYFSHLMTYRGSIKTIMYGLNSSKPTRRHRFPAWRKSGMAPIDQNTPLYIKVPRSTRFATVQLEYKDGTKSDVHRFDYVRQ